MFKQAKVLYIIQEEDEGNPEKIINDFEKYNLVNYLFESESVLNDNTFFTFLSSLPKNTVVCSIVKYEPEEIVDTKTVNIALPFISSHINFPVKLGEHVWFYKYDINDQKLMQTSPYVFDGYYLGRVHSLLNTEDTSYCFAERENTLYVNNKDSISEMIKEKRSGILETLETNDFLLNENAEVNVIYNLDSKVYSDVSNRILNPGSYYKSHLKSYMFKPTLKSSSKIEDLTLKGTYGTVINLTAESLAQDNSQNNINFDTKKGKVLISAGENEKLRENAPLSSKKVKTIDEDGFFDNEGTILNSYGNEISPDCYNGVFFESIKTSKQFFNTIKTDDIYLDNINKINSSSILNNSASFSVSEIDADYFTISDRINYTIPNVRSSFVVKSFPNNILNNKSYKVFQPEFEFLGIDKSIERSSIVGIADSLIFSTHSESTGDIVLSTLNSVDNKENYFKITNNGNIHLDGHKIVIGDANRIQSQNGIDAGLYLGFSSDMHSAVLGEQLKTFIEEMISVQKESISLIKDLFVFSKETDRLLKDSIASVSETVSKLGEEISLAASSSPTATIVALGPAGIGASSNSKSKDSSKINKINIEAYENKIKEFKAFGNINNEEGNSEILYKRLEEIEKNLDKILSKFVKTSWHTLFSYIYIKMIRP